MLIFVQSSLCVVWPHDMGYDVWPTLYAGYTHGQTAHFHLINREFLLKSSNFYEKIVIFVNSHFVCGGLYPRSEGLFTPV